MNDRYLFKAKRIDNGEWVQGYLYGIWERRYILWGMTNDVPDMIEVDPSTICQCTELKDKNGKLIWENDVCKCYNSEDKDGIAIIKEDYASWVSGTIRQTEIMTPMFYLKCGEEWEVIGNIFDGGSENIGK